MNSNSDDLKELSIAELFNPKERYVIPIYQRNYAWGATEVEQLIQDIYDVALQSEKSVKNNKGIIDYYIGSLVVHLRDDGSYETIDGQQRHTTLSILLALLKNSKLHKAKKNNQTVKGNLAATTANSTHNDQKNRQFNVKAGSNIAINLHFDSRPKSARTLIQLYNNKTGVEPEEPTMLSAYNIAERYIKKEKLDLEVLSKYLLNQVKILRVKVPKDTNLNHYFEIMNNRGEQLEKHEVLKARMMGTLKDIVEQRCFSAIWDACADMHRYVQLGFETKIRNKVFGANWSTCPLNFEDVKSCFVESDTNADGMLLSDIIDKRQYRTSDAVNHEETERDERFSSVIDFPNFLLQVLRVNSGVKVPLDDKRLLDIFSDKDNKLNIEPTIFIIQLLKCRMLFDKYIIKRDNSDKDRWSLQTLVPNNKSFAYNNSIGQDQIDKVNEQLIMILSMFHVSYPTNARKRWLSGALTTLLKLAPTTEINITGDKYLTELELLSDNYFYEITGINKSDNLENLMYKTELHTTDASNNNQELHNGTGVQNFIFNRLDYLLWLRLRDKFDFKAMNEELDMAYINKRTNEFKFSFRTSVEHYFPQTSPFSKVNMEGVDRFGNLCLITPSSNSKLSNYSPAEKKKYYADTDRTESLKQTFMMSYDSWEPEGQGLKNIIAHEKMMIKVLCKQ